MDRCKYFYSYKDYYKDDEEDSDVGFCTFNGKMIHVNIEDCKCVNHG